MFLALRSFVRDQLKNFNCVAMPYLVNSIGIYLLFPAFLFFAVITRMYHHVLFSPLEFTLDCLYYLSRKYRITSYPELCQYAIGTPGYLIICFLMFIFNFGTFLGGMMIVGSNLPRLLEWMIGECILKNSRELTDFRRRFSLA